MLIYYLSLVDTPEEKSKIERLYYQYRKLMKYMALKILQQEDTAEDIVQDAFVLLIENLNRIDDIYSNRTKAFIYVIVRNVALNYIKKQKRRTIVAIEDHISRLFIDEDVFGEIYANEWVNLINGLATIYRDVLQLKVQYELSNKEIAKILGVSEATVRKRLERARKLLLEKRGEDNDG